MARKRGDRLEIRTLDEDYGRAMSSREPIQVRVTPKTYVELEIGKLTGGAAATVHLMNAYEPYDSHAVGRVEEDGKILSEPVAEITGWEGPMNMWVVVWLEGANERMTLEKLVFQDENILATRRKVKALEAFMAQEFTPVPENSIYYEDFREGPGEWRTAATEAGFHSELLFSDGQVRLAPAADKTHCKLMSPQIGIEAEIGPETRFEIALGDTGLSRIKVELMTAGAPFDYHQVVPWTPNPACIARRSRSPPAGKVNIGFGSNYGRNCCPRAPRRNAKARDIKSGP